MGRVPLNSFSEVIFDLVIFFLVLILIPFSVFLFVPLYLWRITVKVMAKILRGNRFHELLSDLDLFFLLNDPNPESRPDFVISILVTLEGEVDPEQFQANIYNDIVNARHENGSLMYTRLQQRLTSWLGFLFFEWIPNFEISNHIKIESDAKVTEENKHEFVASRFRCPFPSDGALWDVTMGPSIGRTFVYLRVHHVICDGYSIIKAIMTRGMKINPNQFSLPSKHSYENESCFRKVLKFYNNSIGIPGKYIRENLKMKKSAFQNPYSSNFSGAILVSTTGKIPLYKFKRTKLRLGVPFTAIVCAAISAAMRNYLKKMGSEISINFDEKSINGIGFVSMPRHPDDSILNWCGITDMQISLKGSTLDKRLEIANAQVKGSLGSSYIIAQYYYLKAIGSLPSSISCCLMKPKSFGMMYSNMPGPTAPGHLWNNFMSDVMFWEPLILNNGISISILSYNEYVKIGISTYAHVIKGTEKLKEMTEFIETELEKIFNLENV